jgi:hypothetical protein
LIRFAYFTNLEQSSNSEWSNDWSWDDNEKSSIANKQDKSAESAETRIGFEWLDSFHLSFSPVGNLAIVANMHNIIILQRKWDSNNQAKFTIGARITINENEK